MEKPKRNKILKFLPRTMSEANYHSNPGRSDHPHTHKLKSYARIGLAGPLVTIVPDHESRIRKPNHSSFELGAREPTSPTISCMGQIKYKEKKQEDKKKKNKKVDESNVITAVSSPPREKKKKNTSGFGRLISRGVKPARKSDAALVYDKQLPGHDTQLLNRAASLSQLKLFSSGRNSLANFDWTVPIFPPDTADCHGGDDYSDVEDHEEGPDLVTPPFSTTSQLQSNCPRKDINLWKRRSMAAPHRPLDFNTENS